MAERRAHLVSCSMEQLASHLVAVPVALTDGGNSPTVEVPLQALEANNQTDENSHEHDVDMIAHTQIQVLEQGPVQDAVRLIGNLEESNDFDGRSEVLTHSILKHIYIYIYIFGYIYIYGYIYGSSRHYSVQVRPSAGLPLWVK